MSTNDTTRPAFKLTESRPLLPPGHTKYPFKDMEVGQSFFVPGTSHTPRTAAGAWSKRKGVTLACRIVTEDGVRGIRVWRTA